ncbi:MAG TPA: chemotaxis protein CheB, partial [Longimicrobiales bacterium]
MTSAPGKIVLLGGSAGGIEAVGLILQVLPADVDAALFVVVHLNPSVPSFLPDILQRRTKLHVVSARDGAAIVAGTVYVAPPDRHLTIHDGHVHVARGPLEN